MTAIEKKLGYVFKDPALLKTAMTHSSYVNEHGLKKQDCNERLEYLGDAILEAFSSRYLFEKYPLFMEGELSRTRASLVCEKSLAKAARTLDIGDSLLVGKGMEQSGGRNFDSVLSDAFESLLAALYLDGAKEEAERLVRTLVMSEDDAETPSDPKTELQELVQQKNRTVEYVMLEESGPEHDKHFCFAVRIAGKQYGVGVGRSKKSAQMEAARKTIEEIKESKCI